MKKSEQIWREKNTKSKVVVGKRFLWKVNLLIISAYSGYSNKETSKNLKIFALFVRKSTMIALKSGTFLYALF